MFRRRLAAGGALLLVVIVSRAVLASAGGSTPPGAPAQRAARSSHSARGARARARARAGAHRRARRARRRRRSAGDRQARDSLGPVLMYHVIAAPPPGAPFPGLYVAPEEFAAQMQALKSAGWRPVTARSAARLLGARRATATGKPIVVTFDNGYHSTVHRGTRPVLSGGWDGSRTRASS